MVSWDTSRDEGYDASIRYEAELRAAERLRLRDGWEPVVGWRGEPLEMCRRVGANGKRHDLGLVDGACGLCVVEAEARDVAA
jgi:hypothetical protein